jgi:hypothetical protein
MAAVLRVSALPCIFESRLAVSSLVALDIARNPELHNLRNAITLLLLPHSAVTP